MGLFSLRKKTPRLKGDASPWSSASSTTVTPSPALPEFFAALTPPEQTLRLRVAIDPIREGEDKNALFYIDVNPEESVEAIRQAVAARTGLTSMALFKTRTPWQAQYQAQAYIDRYANPVYLMNHFNTWNLDDPSQLAASLGEIGESNGLQSRSRLRVADWFPSGTGVSDMIQIIACPCPHVPANERPMTFIAHFAPTDPPRSSRPASSSTAPPKRLREPAVVHVSPRATVDELKAAVLEADQRKAGMLDKVVMWRVEMSEQELIVIEERGGLKGGRMPWPYPPTAAVPTALENGSAPLSDYFGNYHFDGSMVHLTVWIHPSASDALAPLVAPPAEQAPAFKYPMTLSPVEEQQRRVSASHSLPPQSPTVSPPPPAHEAVMKAKSRRSRPSTAPAVIVSPSSPTGSAPAFGTTSIFGREKAGSKNGSARSRLARLGPSPLGGKGLGLGIPDDADETTAPTPELDFSNLNLSVEIIDTAPVTPPANPEWLAPEHGLHAGYFNVKSKSLGPAASKRTARVSEYA